MHSLFDTRLKRVIGWFGVAILTACGMSPWWGWAMDPTVIEPSPKHLAELSRLDEDQYSDWLTRFYRHHTAAGVAWQALVVQAVPGEAPLVLAAAHDSSDEEEATHWRCPWPAVHKALARPLDEPVAVKGTHAAVNYLHWLFPIDATATRCLLINQMRPQRRIAHQHLILIGSALLLGAALVTSDRDA